MKYSQAIHLMLCKIISGGKGMRGRGAICKKMLLISSDFSFGFLSQVLLKRTERGPAHSINNHGAHVPYTVFHDDPQ